MQRPLKRDSTLPSVAFLRPLKWKPCSRASRSISSSSLLIALWLARLAEVELELRLVTDPLECLRPHAVHGEPGRLYAERRERRDPVLGEVIGLAPP